VRSTRVFISHSKNKEIVEQIKTMLNVAEVPFDIAVEHESTAIPVPEKVFSAMRNCTAAIICVTADHAPVDSNFQLNQNVLIEIGAAFVLYDRRVILVWDKRLPVPSNLQGLYRCEFEGSELSWSRGMKLMEAVKQFKA
jgi:predicted nucleotide-binding protein